MTGERNENLRQVMLKAAAQIERIARDAEANGDGTMSARLLFIVDDLETAANK